MRRCGHWQDNECGDVRYAPKIVLRALAPESPLLDEFVEACLRDKVEWIFVIGDNCKLVQDIIDELIVGDGSEPSTFITTTWHEGKALEEVLEFARASPPLGGEVQHVIP
jgi:hypothetical protein